MYREKGISPARAFDAILGFDGSENVLVIATSEVNILVEVLGQLTRLRLRATPNNETELVPEAVSSILVLPDHYARKSSETPVTPTELQDIREDGLLSYKETSCHHCLY